MSWFSPSFGEGDNPIQLPKTSVKTTRESKTTTECQNFGVIPQSCNWLEKYKPKKTSDLAVHIKKINELESWLQQPNQGNASSKYLLLSGPSGCGKTTALQTVCKNLGYKVFEWVTPVDRPSDDGEHQNNFEYSKSAVKLFEEYLFRSSRYSSCLTTNLCKKVVLVKDFPNAFLHNPSTFHEILDNFLDKCLTPVVFICSDELVCRKLFPATLKANCVLHTISFNPIPDSRLLKVLKSILAHETKTNKNIKMLSDGNLGAMCTSCQGDLRSAIVKMFFCAIKSDFDFAQFESKGKLKKAKLAGKETPPNKDLKLDFFRGVGRVLYPKRIDSEKGLRFTHSPDEIVDQFLQEPNSFLSQIHENYPSKMGNIETLSLAADWLARSDCLSRWQDREIFTAYSLLGAVRGLMVANRPQSVASGTAPAHKRSFESFKRSTTSRLSQDSKALQLEGKALFAETSCLDYQRLLDILPFASLLMPDLNPGQLDYVRKNCTFKYII